MDLIAEMTVINPFDFFLEEYAEKYPFAYPEQLAKELAPYLEVREQGPLLTEFLKTLPRSEQGVVDFLVAANQAVNQTVAYSIRMEPGVQSCEETLAKKLGSCRDSGWLLVQVLRHMGLAARFVSGYLVQLVADVKALDGPSGTDHDFTDLHAWAEVYIPGAGWVGWIRLRGCLPARVTFRWPAPPITLVRRRSAADLSARRKRVSNLPTASAGYTRIRASPNLTPNGNGPRSMRWARKSTPNCWPATSG